MSPDFMRRAIALAVENVHAGNGGPFAAVIVKEDRIIAEGTNRVTLTNDPTAHAEVVAIREACRALADFQLRGCDLYTTCEPCPMCLGAIYWARPARIFYAATRDDAAAIGFDDDHIYQELEKANDEREMVLMNLMRDEAVAVFRQWAAKPDKVEYEFVIS